MNAIQVFTALYVRYASDDWELDEHERDELEQAYQEFISNAKTLLVKAKEVVEFSKTGSLKLNTETKYELLGRMYSRGF